MAVRCFCVGMILLMLVFVEVYHFVSVVRYRTFLKKTQSNSAHLVFIESVIQSYHTNSTSKTDLHAGEAIRNTVLATDRTPAQMNLVNAPNRSSHELVQFLTNRTYRSLKATGMGNIARKVDVVLARSDHFGHRMTEAGVTRLSWVDPVAELVTNLPWVHHTAAWWKHAANRSISVSTIVDMGKKPNYYGVFAKEFAAGNFMKAAKLLSPYNNGEDAWPSVAVVENAVIFREGQIHNGSHIIHGKGCRLGHAALTFNPQGNSRFHVVATIADYWGFGYFHFVAENLVRIPLVLPVIEQLPMSMIHVHTKRHFVISLLGAVGVPSNRVIEGTISADVALLPEPIPCGTPPALLLHLLRRTILLKNHNFGIHHHLNPSVECQILVVMRKGSRRITNHEHLVLGLKNNFKTCAVLVHTGDEKTIEQMKLFRASSLVIAPHGAGLTNILACRKRTLVFEFLVPGASVNICYMAMSFKLQLNYVSLAVPGASHSGYMTVHINDAISLLKSVTQSSEI